MIKHDLAELLVRAGQAAQDAGELPAVALGSVPVERSGDPKRGDYASSIAMRLARAAGMPPLTIAQRLVRHLPPESAVARVDVAPPGFINFGLSREWLQQQVEAIVAAGADFGRVDLGRGQSVQLEFVSANPTGYLNAVSGRAASLGDALANVLDFAGYRVQREYYVNDAGRQVGTFYRSVLARYKQAFGRDAELPQDGYQGSDPTTIAAQLKERYGGRFLDMPEEQAIDEIGPVVLEMVLDQDRADLDLLGVRYDNWYSEQTLHKAGLVGQMIDSMRQNGRVAEREGAIWFASTELGDDRDHVLVRSNGTPTYLAADIAYHYDKLIVRKFDRVIDIWGADHHGHVAGLKAAVEAFGGDPTRLTILLHQMVTLKRGDEIVRMSKRAGDYVALRDVIDEVGRDACRYFFLSRSANVQIDFDLDLAKQEKDENPVYYLQYNYARTASILRKAEGLDPRQGDVSLLSHEAELALIKKMLQYPEVVEAAAAELEPHQLPFYARELASDFSKFYEACRVLGLEDASLTQARLKLVLAANVALGNCLKLMGMTAPERMERADPA